MHVFLKTGIDITGTTKRTNSVKEAGVSCNHSFVLIEAGMLKPWGGRAAVALSLLPSPPQLCWESSLVFTDDVSPGELQRDRTQWSYSER